MYSGYQNLNQLEKQPTVAKLGLVDGTERLGFLCNPETLQWSHSQTRTALNVLGTDNGLSSHQFSQTSLTLPEVRFWTPNNDRDLTVVLDTLESYTAFPGPVLTFALGSMGLDRCHLESFDYRVTQWRSGRPTQATGNLVLTPAPEALEPETFVDPGVVLSPREREDYLDLLVETFPESNEILLAEDGTVTVSGQVIGNILEIKDSL